MRIATLLCGLAVSALAAPAAAFGLRTHLYIADQVWQDLADCRVSIRGHDFEVPGEACRAIQAHRGEFLAGALGPDAFPDVLVGQAIVHPGVPGGRQASDWLGHLLARADSEAERAFAWGYAMHFAGDAFAHSYVNNYAGGVFDLTRGRRKGIELRHFRLEKYIDQQLGWTPDLTQLRIPSAFLARELVAFDYAAGTPRTADFYDQASADPSAFFRDAGRRLRASGPAAPVTTLLAMIDIARVARSRAPAQEAAERARLDAATAAARAVERRWGLPESPSFHPPRDEPAWRALSGAARREVETAYRLRRSAVESWRQARALTAFTATWATDLERAAERYVEASLAFAAATLDDGAEENRQPATAPYRRWLDCYLPVIEGMPATAGDAICARLRAMNSDLSLRRAALLAALGERPRSAYFRLLQIDDYLSGMFEDLAISAIGLGDRAFAQLIDDGLNPAPVTRAALDGAFRRAPNGQLVFACVSDWIDADLGLRDPPQGDGAAACDGAPRSRATLDPERFHALDAALVLARLALLDQEALRRVAASFGGDPATIRMSGQARYSLLLDSVRSLDGSQPWRGRSMPFPRRARWRGAPAVEGAGYPPGSGDGPAGFPFYQTEALRRTVFARLFPHPIEGAILARAEMRPPLYPFRPCPGDLQRGAPDPAATIEICD